ncbi:hypothetical protein CBR_g53740 [Chara braunii]|uniref:Protein SYS1 homolog n=1 Tax=Chara braunii TaxID=69332 RepID=A0A388MBL5_CHABU|nr:hypothetical protein CBR_g53740 [Chara braunii]|eukprot:GBG91849.1 hypothetical protein CBR_g53740 [Chara braunii]
MRGLLRPAVLRTTVLGQFLSLININIVAVIEIGGARLAVGGVGGEEEEEVAEGEGGGKGRGRQGEEKLGDIQCGRRRVISSSKQTIFLSWHSSGSTSRVSGQADRKRSWGDLSADVAKEKTTKLTEGREKRTRVSEGREKGKTDGSLERPVATGRVFLGEAIINRRTHVHAALTAAASEAAAVAGDEFLWERRSLTAASEAAAVAGDEWWRSREVVGSVAEAARRQSAVSARSGDRIHQVSAPTETNIGAESTREEKQAAAAVSATLGDRIQQVSAPTETSTRAESSIGKGEKQGGGRKGAEFSGRAEEEELRRRFAAASLLHYSPSRPSSPRAPPPPPPPSPTSSSLRRDCPALLKLLRGCSLDLVPPPLKGVPSGPIAAAAAAIGPNSSSWSRSLLKRRLRWDEELLLLICDWLRRNGASRGHPPHVGSTSPSLSLPTRGLLRRLLTRSLKAWSGVAEVLTRSSPITGRRETAPQIWSRSAPKRLGNSLGKKDGTTDRKARKRGYRPGSGARPAARAAWLSRVNAMFYGAIVWDPWLILAQITCIQCLYYLSLGLVLWVLVGTRVPTFTLRYFFDYTALTSKSLTGWLTMTAFLCNAFIGAGYLVLLVERAKKCLDFTATMYIIHIFFCLLYAGWPSTFSWWVVNGIGLAIMAVLGEWLCMQKELRDIPIRGGRGAATSSARALPL